MNNTKQEEEQQAKQKKINNIYTPIYILLLCVKALVKNTKTKTLSEKRTYHYNKRKKILKRKIQKHFQKQQNYHEICFYFPIFFQLQNQLA